MVERVARFRNKASWRKPLQFACWAALGCLMGAAVGEVWLAITAPPPAPPPLPPPPPRQVVDQAVVLVLDTSFSMAFGPLEEMKQAALAYVARQDMAHTRIAVVSFDSEAQVKTGLTSDVTALNAAIQDLALGGLTRMDLGLSEAQDQLAGAPEKPNILLFTDGEPNGPLWGADGRDLTRQTAQTIRQRQTRLIAIATGAADTGFLEQVTGDPALVFRAESGQFGEAFQKAERVILPDAPKTSQMIESAPADSGGAGLALMRIAVWTGILGLFMTAALIGAQKRYARQTLNSGDAVAILGGFFAGGAAGAAGQIFFDAASVVPALELGGRIVAWTLLGSGLGAGMALFIPNLRPDRAALGGAVGGALGALGFVVAAAVAGDVAGRWIGAAAVGFCIGLMLVLAEMVFRKAWLHVSYGPADAYDLNLGELAIAVGSDRAQCRIFARDCPALAGRYGLRGGQLYFENAQGTRSSLAPGDERKFGHVTITVRGEQALGAPAMGAKAPSARGPGKVARVAAMPDVPVLPSTMADFPDTPLVVATQVVPTTVVTPVAPPNPALAPTVVRGASVAVVRNPWLLTENAGVTQLPFGGEITLGRGTDNRVFVDDASLSTHHATLRVTKGDLMITDVGSTNGTFVNGFRIPDNKEFRLEVGDEVLVGKRRYEVERGGE